MILIDSDKIAAAISECTRIVQTHPDSSVARQAFTARYELELLQRVANGGCDCAVDGLQYICCEEMEWE